LSTERPVAKKPKVRPPWETEGEEPLPQAHHIYPSSRGGGNNPENILKDTPADTHWAWHRLFGNLTPEEILTALFRYLLKGGRYHDYQRSVSRKGRKPPVMPPDEMILEMIEKIFPEDWVPGDDLMTELERRRGK
jgi:hypothetical protein